MDRKILHFDSLAIKGMDKRFRANFINSVTGFKSANLLGTCDAAGRENLAVFSSVTHLGSDPALLGFITRPTLVPRHTYLNIKETGYFTVNHIHQDIYKQAHHTAARYDDNISEFEKTGLTPLYKENFKAPFVGEAIVQIGCSFVNEYAIKENGTVLIVAAMEHIFLRDGLHHNDGWIDLSSAQTVTVNGLDSYAAPSLIDRLNYSKPNEPTHSILKKE